MLTFHLLKLFNSILLEQKALASSVGNFARAEQDQERVLSDAVKYQQTISFHNPPAAKVENHLLEQSLVHF